MPHTNNSPVVQGGGRPRIMHQHSGGTHSWVQNAPGFMRPDAMMPSIPVNGIVPAVTHRPVLMQPVDAFPISLCSGGCQLMQHGGGSALYEIQNTGLMQPYAMNPSVFPPTASNQFSLPFYFQPTQCVQQNQGFVAQPGSVVMPSQQPHGVKGRKSRILRIEDPTSGEDLTESIIRDSAVDAPVSSKVTSAGSASAPLQYKNPESHEQQKKRRIEAEFLSMVYQKASEVNIGESEGLPQDTAMQSNAVMMVQRKTSTVTTAPIETAQISTPPVSTEEPAAEVSPAAAHMEVPKIAPGTAKHEKAGAAKEPIVSPAVLDKKSDHLSPCKQAGKKQSDQDFPAQIQPDCTSKPTGLPDILKTVPKKNGASSTTVPSLSLEGISFKDLVSLVILLLSLLPSSAASNTVECLPVQYAPLTGRALVRCNGLGDFPLIYWFNNIEDDATAFIKKENGRVRGSGYRAGDYNIDNEGSLVIYNVTIRDEKTFRVRVLDSDLIESSYDITLIVYVEPAEPLPVIPECSGQSTCILKGESDRVISCIHGESRPAMAVSWFLRDGRQDKLLDATVNQMVSADAVTFTASAQLAIEEILFDANMNQLLVLVCKSNQSVPVMKGTERNVLLDNSVDDPFKNAENHDPAYAFEREEDFKIKCQSEIDTRDNVVLWMYKSWNSEDFENILYSAYGEVAFTTKGEGGFNITDDGALVIKQVHQQHEGYYACVSSLGTTFAKNLEVIVLPKPPRILVQGCKPFQPCHLSAQEAETITCTVNGVRPLVDLSIVTYPTNVAVTKTTVSSYKKDGLFYTTVEGGLNGTKDTCRKNVTVICQAHGPAAYGFMSDAYITVSVDGEECIDSSTAAVLPDDDGSYNSLQLAPIIVAAVAVVAAVAAVAVVGAAVACFLYQRQLRRNLPCSTTPKTHVNVSEKEKTECNGLTEPISPV